MASQVSGDELFPATLPTRLAGAVGQVNSASLAGFHMTNSEPGDQRVRAAASKVFWWSSSTRRARTAAASSRSTGVVISQPMQASVTL